MKNNKKYTIKIAQVVAPIVGSRDIVHSLAAIIKKSRSSVVDLDFEHVNFISRSAAHEFLLLKEKFQQQKNIRLSFSHADENVANMLRVVASNRAVPKSTPVLKIEKVSLRKLFA